LTPRARQALIDNGAESVEIVPVPTWDRALSLVGFLRIIAAIVAACVVAGAGLFAAEKLIPVVPPMIHMHDQPKLNAFRESAFFADGRGMRPAVAGTVARGHLPPAFATPEEAGTLLSNPLPLTQAIAERGRKVFQRPLCHLPRSCGRRRAAAFARLRRQTRQFPVQRDTRSP
jgi:hypothetical protein